MLFYHLLNKYIAWYRDTFAIHRFDDHKKQSNIAHPSTNFIILIHDTYGVIQFDRVIEKYDDTGGDVG